MGVIPRADLLATVPNFLDMAKRMVEERGVAYPVVILFSERFAHPGYTSRIADDHVSASPDYLLSGGPGGNDLPETMVLEVRPSEDDWVDAVADIIRRIVVTEDVYTVIQIRTAILQEPDSEPEEWGGRDVAELIADGVPIKEGILLDFEDVSGSQGWFLPYTTADGAAVFSETISLGESLSSTPAYLHKQALN